MEWPPTSVFIYLCHVNLVYGVETHLWVYPPRPIEFEARWFGI